ncbi:MAG: arginine N-succinyltransferase, partial [Vicinamibacteria bacterium]
FILSLFPTNETYLCIFPKNVHEWLGSEHQEATPARHILEKAGFRYLEQIDPFDAGPYFSASFGEIRPIRRTKTFRLGPPLEAEGSRLGLVSIEDAAGFRAMQSSFATRGKSLRIERPRMEGLGAKEGVRVSLTPY